MAVGPAKRGDGAVIGLFKGLKSWQVVDASGCAVNHPRLAEATRELQRVLDSLRGVILPFDHDSGDRRVLWTPSLRYVELTLEKSTGLVQLVLVWNGSRHQPAPALERLLDVLWPLNAAGSGCDDDGEQVVPDRCGLPRLRLCASQADGISSAPRTWHSIWVHWRDPDPGLSRAIHSKDPEAWEQVRPLSTTAGVLESHMRRRGRGVFDADAAAVLASLDGLNFAFGPASFMQANLIVFEEILRDMKAALRTLIADGGEGGGRLVEEGKPLRLLELCGGVGVIGLSLAHAAAGWQDLRLSGVSLVSTDVNPNCARHFEASARSVFPDLEDGKADGIEVSFAALSASEALQRTVSGREEGDQGGAAQADDGSGDFDAADSCDVLVMDPPRRGLAEHMYQLGLYGGEKEAAEIRASSARAVIYMSCGYEAFMMDADRLTGDDPHAKGTCWGPPFELAALKCYDMFPFTGHVETLAVFVRQEAGDARCRRAVAEATRGGWRRARKRLQEEPVEEKLLCQFYIGIEPEPDYPVAAKIIGPQGKNMKAIAERTGALLRLRGRGSGFKEGPRRLESRDPLMLSVSVSRGREDYDEAVYLVRALIEDLHEDYRAFCRQSGRAPPGGLKVRMSEGRREDSFKKGYRSF